MNYTTEQKAVIDTDIRRSEALRVSAFAGTGKTSTLVGYSNAREHLPTLYAAFNKSVELEAKRKFAPHVTTKTVHSLAYGKFGRNYSDRLGNVSVFVVARAFNVRIAVASMIIHTLESWYNSADAKISEKHVPHCTSDGEVLDDIVVGNIAECATAAWDRILRKEDYWPMAHSGYLKLFQLSKPELPYDLIMVDEFQDTNPVTLDIFVRQMSFGKRLLIVGDAYQSIYGWRGAVDALSLLSAPTLYLTQSFRFGQNVADVANALLHTFYREARPLQGCAEADEVCTEVPENTRYTIVSRNNATLFDAAANAATTGKKICLVGLSLEQLLQDVSDVYKVYQGNSAEATSKKIQRFRSFADLKEYATMADPELLSKVTIVERNKDAIPGMSAALRRAEGDVVTAQAMFTTCHKAKGLEWNTVMLADDYNTLYTDPKGDRPAQLRRIRLLGEQSDTTILPDEVNLYYVGATRAKNRLCILNHDLNTLLRSRKLGTLVLPEPMNLDEKAEIVKRQVGGCRLLTETFAAVEARRADKAANEDAPVVRKPARQMPSYRGSELPF